MTLDEAVRDAQQWLQEEQSTPGGGSPFSWPGLVTSATDALCADTGCLVAVYQKPAGFCERDFVWPTGVRRAATWRVHVPGGGIGFVGFRSPGKAWEIDEASGVVLPLVGTSVCPLPDWATAAVPVKAALLRVTMFPTQETAARGPGLLAEYRSRMGNVAMLAQQEYRRIVSELRVGTY